IGEGSTDAERVLACVIEMEVHLSDQCTVVAMAGRVESETAEVESAILISGIVAVRILIEHGLHLGVDADPQRIHQLNLVRRQRLRRAMGELELEKPLAQRVGGDEPVLRYPARVSALLIVEEVKRAIFD